MARYNATPEQRRQAELHAARARAIMSSLRPLMSDDVKERVGNGYVLSLEDTQLWKAIKPQIEAIRAARKLRKSSGERTVMGRACKKISEFYSQAYPDLMKLHVRPTRHLMDVKDTPIKLPTVFSNMAMWTRELPSCHVRYGKLNFALISCIHGVVEKRPCGTDVYHGVICAGFSALSKYYPYAKTYQLIEGYITRAGNEMIFDQNKSRLLTRAVDLEISYMLKHGGR